MASSKFWLLAVLVVIISTVLGVKDSGGQISEDSRTTSHGLFVRKDEAMDRRVGRDRPKASHASIQAFYPSAQDLAGVKDLQNTPLHGPKASSANQPTHTTAGNNQNSPAICTIANHTNCPPWFYPRCTDSGAQCVCGNELDGAVYCDQNITQAYLLNCNCMTNDIERNKMVVGACVYGCFDYQSYTSKDSTYLQLPPSVEQLSNFSCRRYNREGQLCGNCREDFVLPSYSYNPKCIKCTYSAWNWVKYILVAYVPLTVFFVVIVGSRFSATSGQLNAFVLIAQGLSTPASARSIVAAIEISHRVPGTVSVLLMVLGTMYGIWNLDFFRLLPLNICLNLSSLQELILDYAIAFYPLVLISATYLFISLYERNFRIVVWLWQPFRRAYICLRRQLDVRTSIIEAFATFIILSYVKILSVSCDILIPTRVFDRHGHVHLFLFYNASIEYFGEEHQPYAIVAMFVTLICSLFPLVFLGLYPLRSFQRFLRCCGLHSLTLTIVMDAFLGHYKDGTNGTRDCRYFTGIYLLAITTSHMAYAFVPSRFYYVLSIVIFIALTLVIVYFQPYRSWQHNSISVGLLLPFITLCISVIALEVATSMHNLLLIKVSYILFIITIAVPALYITALALFWVIYNKRAPQQCLAWMWRCWRSRFGQDAFAPALPRLRNAEESRPLIPAAVDVN